MSERESRSAFAIEVYLMEGLEKTDLVGGAATVEQAIQIACAAYVAFQANAPVTTRGVAVFEGAQVHARIGAV